MAKFGVPTDEQLAKINKLAKRTLSADEVFCFSGKSAGDMMIPGRFMMLSPELLKVMADDAKKGVSFMLNHNWSSFGMQGVPYGKVFDGRLENSNGNNETLSLLLEKYIVRDDEVVDGVSANALIKKIETGVLSDTSIGWGTDIMTCSICGMNYYGGQCSHLKGRTYEMADGSMKLCTVTAMPPSMMIPYNNNALFEESIVWDGAYPGACVTQSKHGDIIELPTGKFSIVQDKEELPEGTLFHGYYHNGDIVTMVKKSDHKKVFKGGVVSAESTANISDDDILPPSIAQQLENAIKSLSAKGVEKPMNEKLTKLLETLGIAYKEGETKAEELLNQLAEKWEAFSKTLEPQEGLSDVFMTAEQVKEKLGKDLTADEVLKLAKAGQTYKQHLVEYAINRGICQHGNDYPAETYKAMFESSSIEGLEKIVVDYKKVIDGIIPAGRSTDPAAGQQQAASLPDEAYKVGK